MIAEIPDCVFRAWNSTLVAEQKLKDGVWLVRSGAQEYVLKRRSQTHRAEREYQIATILESFGVPVAVPLKTIDRSLCCTTSDTSWMLYPFMSGRTVSLVTVNKSEAVALGVSLAKLHVALDHVPLYTDIPTLAFCSKGLPSGLIHRDFHPSNVLVDRCNVSAILDFDLLCYGARLFDVAYVGASLLSEGFSACDRFHCILAEVVRGYFEIRPLTKLEIEELPVALECIEDLFIELGCEIGNRQVEDGARELKAWLERQRQHTKSILSELVR